MKKLGINSVEITKKDLVELRIGRDELVRKFEDMLQGSYENPKGDEFEAIALLKGDSSGLYIRLHAPWSPNNINICWKLEVYSFTVGDKNANYVYEFKTISLGTMEWYIHSNLAYVFE